MAGSEAAARLASEVSRAKEAASGAAKRVGSTDLGQKTKQLATHTANATKKYAAEAKSKGAAAAKAAKRQIREKALALASTAASKVVNKAIDSVSTSMGRDPYMPGPVLQAVDSILNDIKGDAEIMLRENLESVISGTDKATVAKITATYRGMLLPEPALMVQGCPALHNDTQRPIHLVADTPASLVALHCHLSFPAVRSRSSVVGPPVLLARFPRRVPARELHGQSENHGRHISRPATVVYWDLDLHFLYRAGHVQHRRPRCWNWRARSCSRLCFSVFRRHLCTLRPY